MRLATNMQMYGQLLLQSSAIGSLTAKLNAHQNSTFHVQSHNMSCYKSILKQANHRQMCDNN